MSEGNIPSIDDFLIKSNDNPSIENFTEQSELPSIEDFKEKKEVEDTEPVVLEEEVKEIEEKQLLTETQDLTEVLRLINDVRKDIPEIPQVKYYDDELKQLSEQIEEVQRNIPEVPEVKYYDDEIKLIKEDLNEYKSSAFPNFLGKLFEGIKSSVDTDIDLIKENITTINFEKKIIEGNIKNTKNDITESIDNIKKQIDKELSESATRIYELKLHLKDDDRKLKKQLLGQYNLLKENIEKKVEDFNQKNIEVQNITTSSLKEYFDEIKKSIDELPEVKYYDKQIIELRKEVKEIKNKEIESLKNIVEELKSKQSELNENIIDAPPSEDNSDPLTPLDQNFVTLDELQNHYRLFVNRIQQQLSSFGGGGEVRVLRMDDVDTTDLGDAKVLSYDASSEKLKFVDQSGGGGSGVSTANVRTGILDVAGIATFRSNTLVGTGVTLSPDGDIFATGVTTSTTFVGALTGNVTGNTSGSSGSCTGNAATATTLANARTIAGVSFDGSANISLNNNAITNGAGFIDGSALNASNLSSGTIPDARFPSTLPAISGANLTGIAATANVRTGILDVAGIATFRNDIIIGSGVTLSPDGDIFATGVTTAMNSITLKSDDGTPGRIDLYCESNNAHYARIQAPAHSDFGGNITLTLPSSTGTLLTSVGTSNIDDDAVTEAKLANAINTAIAANTAKTTNATHTGEVTGSTALTIADNVVDEANLKVSNSPTDGYFLSAQSGNTGGLTWAAASGGGGASMDANSNFVVGTDAGNSLSGDENNNIFIGDEAGYSVDYGGTDGNICIGYKAGRGVNYFGNTFIGHQAAYQATGTTFNTTVLGASCAQAYTAMSASVLIGAQAASAGSQTTFNNNTVVGMRCGKNVYMNNTLYGKETCRNSSGSIRYINAFGEYAARSVVGESVYLNAFGHESSYSNTSGANNSSFGHKSAYNTNTGSDNTSIGYQAGDLITTGDNNISIGKDSDPSAADADNEITLGNSSNDTIRCNTQTISTLSDARDKTDVNQLELGLDFVDSLKPVKFKWKTRDGNSKDGSYEAGFIAQDFQKVQKDNDADYLKLVHDHNPEKLEASYGKLVPVLVRAIQELKQEIEELKSNV